MTNETAITTTAQTDNREHLIHPQWIADRAKAAKAYLVHKDNFYRVGAFVEWLDATGKHWTQPSLEAYRDYLLKDRPRTLAPATVKAHLHTLRARYKAIMSDNATRDYLYTRIPADVTGEANRKAYLDETITRIENDIAPGKIKVSITTVQDEADDKHLRLTKSQMEALISTPGVGNLKTLRDTAIIALIACTGIREAELVGLDVADLRVDFGGEMSLRVSHGKGNKQRLIPYGELSWCLLFVDAWMNATGIKDGPVFRGMYRGNKSIRPNRLTTRAVIGIVDTYPVFIKAEKRKIQVHDLRRSYAKNLFMAGTPVEIIRQNLGHASTVTTQGYIGILDASERRPPAIYAPPSDLIEQLVMVA